MQRRHFLEALAALPVLESAGSGVASDTARTNGAPVVPLHLSPTVYPGETIGVWGQLAGAALEAKLIAPAWRGRAVSSRQIKFEVQQGAGAGVGYAAYPFEECRPFYVVFAGSGKGAKLWGNRPRLDWVEHGTVYPGQTIRLFGRNLHCVNTVEIRSGAGRPMYPGVVNAAPYVWETRVPECAPGDYGLILDETEVARLQVVARGADILGLRVAWAREFRWDKVIPISPGELKSLPDDNSAVLQAALNRAAEQGGGVVLLPPGEFGIRSVEIPRGVVLMGSGRGISVLRYLGGEPEAAPHYSVASRTTRYGTAHGMLNAKAGPAGIARLSLVCDLMQPDDGLRRIDGFVIGFQANAHGSRFIFASDVGVDFRSGTGIRAVADSDVLVQQCEVKVPCVGVWVDARQPLGRAALRDCKITNQQRPTAVLSAACSVFERNHLTGDNKILWWCSAEHRIADFAAPYPGCQYVAENVAEGVFGSPDLNDGEGFNWQAQSRLAYAPVSRADPASLTDDTQAFKPGSLKDCVVVIVKGKGAGQLRRIVDNTATRMVVGPGWEIVPDASCNYTVDKLIGTLRCIVVNNRLSGVKKRAIDFYVKNYDNWVQGNVVVNAGGIFLDATENTAQKRLDMAYFNTVRDNLVMGQPIDPATGLPQQKLLLTDHGLGWGIRIGHIDKENSKNTLPSIAVYGNEVRHNVVYGSMPDERAAGIIIGVEIEASDSPSAVGNIIEGNELHGMPVGIRLGKNVANTRIGSNRYFLRGSGAIEIQRGGPLYR